MLSTRKPAAAKRCRWIGSYHSIWRMEVPHSRVQRTPRTHHWARLSNSGTLAKQLFLLTSELSSNRLIGSTLSGATAR